MAIAGATSGMLTLGWQTRRYSSQGRVELVLSNRLSVAQRAQSAHARFVAKIVGRIKGSAELDMKRFMPYFLTFFS
jgi:hypothetical protein